jgi:hypothetical protein
VTFAPGVIVSDVEEQDNNGTSPRRTGEVGPVQVARDRPGKSNVDLSSEINMLPYLWLYAAIGFPLLILGIRDGWGYLFRSGDAAAFIVGAIFGALVENIIELSPGKFALLKKVLSGLRGSSSKSEDDRLVSTIVRVIRYYIIVALFSYYIVALVFLGWNIVFSFSDLTVHHPSVDWVQIVVFFIPLCLLPIIRFIFTAESPFPLRQMGDFVTNRRAE